MKRVLRIAGTTLFMMVMCFSMLTSKVCAADTCKAEIPVSVVLSGNVPEEGEDYVVRLQGCGINTPMPEGSTEDMYTLVVKGEGKALFPAIEYSKVGIYSYKVWQGAGSQALGTYDGTVYDVSVYVTNALDGSGLESTIVVYRQGETTEKCELEFKNEYAYPAPTPTPPAQMPTPSTGTLIQTGQLNWPIPVLAAAGSILMLFGLYMMIHRKRGNHA